MSVFEIGNLYSKKERNHKTLYIAVSHRTLVTCKSGKFGRYTTKKNGYISESNISVAELCEYWNIKLTEFDKYMLNFFQPDEAAKKRAHKEKQERDLEKVQELELIPAD